MLKIFESVSGCLSSGESLIGDLHFRKNNLIVPFQNLYVMEDCKQDGLRDCECKYINYSYILFRNVEAIAWCDDNFRKLGGFLDCYGGGTYPAKGFHEFWIKYERADLILLHDSTFSSKMFPLDDKVLTKFFATTDYHEIAKSCKL